ncbi:MAG TPA: nucleotide pyrophosphohydrolase [Thermoanaerobaculia bacterium]|nr:nucleotide pyrophosphohydrolase [Thermoanaerobaculia bacterium]
MTLQDAQKTVDDWIGQFEEGYFPPLPMLARLTEEVGELAREINHRYGGKVPKPGERDREIAEEIGDVLFVLVCLANSLEVDLDDALAAVIEKYRVRDGKRWTVKKSEDHSSE